MRELFPTDAQLDWLQAELLAAPRRKDARGIQRRTMPPPADLARAFRRRFGVPVTAGWIERQVERHWRGWHAEPTTRLTWAQRRFLRRVWGASCRTAREAAAALNERFGLDLTRRQVACWVGEERRRGRPLRPLPGGGRFRRGGPSPCTVPVGTVKVMTGRKDHGALYVKVADPHPYTGRPGHMRPLRLVVWERERGPVPDGHCIVMLDGDPANCGIDNLECVTRAELARLNQMHWHDLPSDPDTRRAAVAAARLKQAAFDAAPSPSTLWQRRKAAAAGAAP